MDELSIVTLAAAKKYTDEHGGGGGGGTSNYNQLENKPQIAGVTLQGNKSLADLGIASSTDLANKVDKETGKGLSTNDYTNTDKAIVDGVTAALSGKQDALTAGLYIEFDGNEISVKRDITQTAQEIAYNFTIPSDFTLRVKKYVNSDLVDTTDYTWNSVTDPINLDSIMEVSKKAGNYWVVKNLIASTTQAADYSVDLYAMQQATDYTQNFVATIDADKKLIIQSELDAALADKVDKVTGKGLSKNDYTDADKAKVDASLNVFTGTQAEWAALSTAEKKTYQRADFTDDYDNTAVGDLTALHTSAKSSIVNAINEVADGKQNSTDNNLQTTAKTIVGGINEVKSGLTNLLKYKVCNDVASDTTNHLYSTGVPVSNYVCVGGCAPNNPNYCVEISNIEVASGGNIRYRLYDVSTNQVVSDNAAYLVYLVFVDTSMLSELVITP